MLFWLFLAVMTLWLLVAVAAICGIAVWLVRDHRASLPGLDVRTDAAYAEVCRRVHAEYECSNVTPVDFGCRRARGGVA